MSPPLFLVLDITASGGRLFKWALLGLLANFTLVPWMAACANIAQLSIDHDLAFWFTILLRCVEMTRSFPHFLHFLVHCCRRPSSVCQHQITHILYNFHFLFLLPSSHCHFLSLVQLGTLLVLPCRHHVIMSLKTCVVVTLGLRCP